MRDTIENYIQEYPNQQQVKMMQAWLHHNEPGTFRFTGLVDPTDATVITPQASVDYGYCWFRSCCCAPARTHPPAITRW